ncbi:MAG TPA: type II secretion system ATPase GspE [Chlamydiales bacterium]|jgi:general secretion pathway protein E|nr:type II secretion system ATPase GspE [Chlamydiales bacterium]
MRQLAEKFGLDILDELLECRLVREQISIVPYGLAKQKKLLPIDETASECLIALSNLADLEAVEELRLILRRPLRFVYAPETAVEEAIEHCYRQKEGEAQKLFIGVDGKEYTGSDAIDSYDLLENKEENPIIRMINAILLEAIQQKSSDIHFEPSQESLSIRYRIDGVLHQRHNPSRGLEAQLCTRIKVMAKMDIAEHRLPQDGRIKLHHGGREIDFRVSTLPTVHGERIVLRILDKGNVVLGLDQIGMDDQSLQGLRKLIQMPEGIVLVTGPTGSGKTTTLYSAISEIHSSEMNIMTIEDPVEYKLPGISQMNVNPRIELDFAKGLRSILRQDPDVIMIGEIRDRETAEIAIQASLTGHLVLSTLHTNDAPSALTRLADMGIEPYLLASSILGVLAQRLVRRICPDCKISYVPSAEELKELNLGEENLKKYRLHKGAGCTHCFGSGFRGRLGVYELMPVTSRIKAQVLKSQDSEALRKVALEQEMLGLFGRGVQLVLAGLTTSAEILRVTRISEDNEDHGSVSL